MDLFGPTRTTSLGGKKYALVIVDDVGFLMQLITLISGGRHEKHTRIASYIV